MEEADKQDVVAVAMTISPDHIVETLKDLIVRERALLDGLVDEDLRLITLHNIAVLTAACAGYEKAVLQSEWRLSA